jgi:hypothetical protein
MSTIEALLAEVAEARAVLSVERGKLVSRGEVLPDGLVARLLAAKPAVVEALRRQDRQSRPAGAPKPAAPDPSRCRYCGAFAGWPGPAMAFADGSSAHVACYERAEVERLLAAARRVVESPDALADPAELLLRGEDLS